MFDDFFDKCPMTDEIHASRKTLNKDKAAVIAKIGHESPQKKRIKKAAIIPIAAAAAMCLTVSAGAAASRLFGGFFGAGTGKIKPYLVSESSYEIVKDTFEDYDFEITGVAADENIIYIGLDIIALKEMNVKEFVRSDFLCDGVRPDNYGVNRWYISEGKKRSSMLLTVDHCGTEISEDCNVTLCLNSMFAKDKWHPLGYAFGNTETATTGELEINMRLKKSETKNIAVNREMTVPIRIGRVGRDTVSGEQQWLIKDIGVSGLSVTLTAEHPYSDDECYDLNVYEKKLKLRLSDGTAVALQGYGGGEVIFDENGNGIWYKANCLFTVETPVNLDEVEAVLIGDNVIPVS